MNTQSVLRWSISATVAAILAACLSACAKNTVEIATFGPIITVATPDPTFFGVTPELDAVREIKGEDTTLNNPVEVAVDDRANIYVLEGDSRVAEFAATANGDTAPVRTIGGPDVPKFSTITTLSEGRVLGAQGGSVFLFDSHAAGDSTPKRVARINDLGSNYITKLSLGSSGRVIGRVRDANDDPSFHEIYIGSGASNLLGHTSGMRDITYCLGGLVVDYGGPLNLYESSAFGDFSNKSEPLMMSAMDPAGWTGLACSPDGNVLVAYTLGDSSAWGVLIRHGEPSIEFHIAQSNAVSVSVDNDQYVYVLVNPDLANAP